LGPYEILYAIGAGGMGEVYRARDCRLDRDVALKVLPEAFARDPDRMVRFEREAKVLASLNHPHIASLYGLEESNGACALVMELVEGPTLSERIKQGLLPIACLWRIVILSMTPQDSPSCDHSASAICSLFSSTLIYV
jgi:serine/threonine protein kinase